MNKFILLLLFITLPKLIFSQVYHENIDVSKAEVEISSDHLKMGGSSLEQGDELIYSSYI